MENKENVKKNEEEHEKEEKESELMKGLRMRR